MFEEIAGNPDALKLVLTGAGTALGFMATLTATLLGVYMKGVNRRFGVLEAKMDEKADKSRVETIAMNLTKAFEQQREDSQRVQGMIRDVGETMNSQHQAILVALGDRPTRQELAQQRQQLRQEINMELDRRKI